MVPNSINDGFGYAPSIDDYKVIRLCRKKSGEYYPRCYSELQVEIYSLKANSWKIIPGVPPTNITYGHLTVRGGTHVRGSIYWIIYDSQNAAIIAFDLTTERFKLLETPSLDDDNVNFRKLPTTILQVRGCLGAYRSVRNSDDTVIWILNEDGNKKGYWTKLLAIPRIHETFPRVLSFMNNNEVLLYAVKGDSPKLVIYDAACKTVRYIPCGKVRWPVYMVETLVSPLSS